MPPQAGGETTGGELSLFDLGRYAGKAGKKAAEMGRFFASEWLREPGAQEMLVRKVNPFLKKGIDQLSTAIRPKRNYKTNRKDLDGGAVAGSGFAGSGFAGSGFAGSGFAGSGLLSNLAYGFNYARGQDRQKKERERSEEKESTFTKQSGNFQNQKKDGLSLGIITLGHIIHWNNS